MMSGLHWARINNYNVINVVLGAYGCYPKAIYLAMYDIVTTMS